MRLRLRPAAGFSLVEVIVVSAVALIFFAGLFSIVIYVGDLVTDARVRLSALSSATERIEYIRSLAYDSVGTVAGIPNGLIPQQRTVTRNGYQFNERVLIEFVDDDADGFGPGDSNSIVSDYKRVKIEYSWNVTGATSSLELISTVVPRSIETTAGGGTIRVNVFDATVTPLPGASVRLRNTSGTSTIDVTRLTDAAGAALFAGAPAGSNYEIFVSRAGYSSAQTYVATTSNPNPNPAPIAVLEADVSTVNFQIDRLADVSVQVFSTIVENVVTESFVDILGLATSTDVTVASGSLVLADTAGVYQNDGIAYIPVAPNPLERFEVIALATNQPTNTNVRVRLYTGTSTFTLIPEADAPGNTAGFEDRYIDLRALNAAAYPEFVLGIELSTANTAVTPRVDEVSVYYRESATPRSNQSLTLRGDKVIGATADLVPIRKYEVTTTTNSAGYLRAYGNEWDSYTLSFSGDVIRSACPQNPFAVAPGSDTSIEVEIGGASLHNLRLQVVSSDGLPVPGVAVKLRRSGVLLTDTTDACGGAFFSSGTLTSASDYEIEMTAPGFATTTLTGETITGARVLITSLSGA